MRIEISFYGFVRDLVSTPKLVIDSPERATVREVLDSVVKRYGETLRERLLSTTGELAANVQVFVGEHPTTSLDQSIDHAHDQSAEVKVFVLSATAGG